MLLPLVGFVLGCICFTILGGFILTRILKLSLSFANLLLFVAGAFAGTLFLGYCYGRAFAAANNELKGSAAVIGMFVVMLIGAVVGGTSLVWIKARIVNTS